MKRFSLYTLALVLAANTMILSAQTTSDDIEQRYRRSSLCSILVKHTEDKFAKEIEEQFLNIPIDDKYNEHNLSVRVVSVSSKGDYQRDINNFVESNNIGSRILARWFNRNRFNEPVRVRYRKCLGQALNCRTVDRDPIRSHFEFRNKELVGDLAYYKCHEVL